MNFGPGRMNQSPNVKISRMVTCWITKMSQIPPKPFPCEVGGHCGKWRFRSDCHFVPQGRTVIADYYRSFLQRQLHLAVREKCPHLLNNVIILHDNARPRTTGNAKLQLECWEWEVLGHLSYSPRICLHVILISFPKWRYHCLGDSSHMRWHYWRCETWDVKIHNRGAGGIQHLPHHWQQTVDALGDYFEGLWVRTSTVFLNYLCVS